MTTASLLSATAGAGRLSRSASRIVTKVASGFHLLRVVGYSHTKTVPRGECITSPSFSIGGSRHCGTQWCVKYYPNGRDSSTNSDYISIYLKLLHEPHLQTQYKMSIIDQAGNVAYGLPAKTGVFGYRNGAGECGYEHFIPREDLERREDLLKDDCVVFRCDVGGFTALATLCLAYDDDDDEYDLKPCSPRRSHDPRRPDDNEFIQWCLAQKRMG